MFESPGAAVDVACQQCMKGALREKHRLFRFLTTTKYQGIAKTEYAICF